MFATQVRMQQLSPKHSVVDSACSPWHPFSRRRSWTAIWPLACDIGGKIARSVTAQAEVGHFRMWVQQKERQPAGIKAPPLRDLRERWRISPPVRLSRLDNVTRCAPALRQAFPVRNVVCGGRCGHDGQRTQQSRRSCVAQHVGSFRFAVPKNDQSHP